MPLFDYTASDRDGVLSRGQIEGSDRPSAGLELTQSGLFVLEMKPAVSPSNSRVDDPRERPAIVHLGGSLVETPVPEPTPSAPAPEESTASGADQQADLMEKTVAVEHPERAASGWLPRRTWSRLSRALYLRQLQMMFTAGIPLYRSAAVLAEGHEYDPEVYQKLSNIPRDLERGRVLSKALERTGIFNSLIVSSVRLGEESGRLDSILEALSDNEERGVQLTRTLISRLTYPLVVLVSMSCGLLLLGHVMSRVMSDVPALNGSLNPAVKFLTGLFQSPALLPGLLLSLALLTMIARQLWSYPLLRLAAEQQVMRWPVVGPLLRRLEANIVTSHLALLLKAGLPLDRALRLCSDLVHSSSFRRALRVSQQELRDGEELGASFHKAQLFPEDVLALIQAGELSGSLEESLERAARYCAEQVERTLETALAIIEPLLIAFLGISIGVVLILTFVPIFNSLKDL